LSGRSREANCTAIARELFGLPGRRIGRSKRVYLEEHPDSKATAVFNARVCLRPDRSWQGVCWIGDLELSSDEFLLVELARRVGETVFVLEEMDARLATGAPPLERAVYRVSSTGASDFDHTSIERGSDGGLRTRRPEPHR
jgi:hypothetical protein